MPLHDNELNIDRNLVRRLLDSQFPEFAALPLSPLAATGSSNALFRLGDKLLVRLPRQPGGGVVLEKEQRCQSMLADHLPVAVPDIVAVAEPDQGFDERWSLVRWLEGDTPPVFEPGVPSGPSRSQLAAELADVILALRAMPVSEPDHIDPAFTSYRGGPLARLDSTFRRAVDTCREFEDFDLDPEAALAVWSDALDLPGADTAGRRCWFHGDLVAENLLLQQGRLTAVLDFGGLSIGDPTVDLHGAWELFDPAARAVFRQRLAADDAEWLRGRAWALAIAFIALSYYWHTLPGRRRDRLAMARAVLTDPG